MSSTTVIENIILFFVILAADIAVEYLKVLYKRYKRKQKRLMLEKIKNEKERKEKINTISNSIKEQTVKRL